MRLLHTFDNPKTAHLFSDFLKGEGIDNQCEIKTNDDWGSHEYGDRAANIWIIEEDQTPTAEQWLEKYLQNPNDPVFTENLAGIKEALIKTPRQLLERGLPVNQPKTGPVTLAIFAACILIFGWGVWTEPKVPVEAPKLPPTALYSPKINKVLMYDYPKVYEYADLLIKEYGYEKLDDPQDLPLQAQVLMAATTRMPIWNGIYDQLEAKIKQPGYQWNFTAPLFEKIRQGEIWRIVTPIFLHFNEFHIFFNLLWLLMLGKLIEERTGPIRYIILILIIAAVSNTAQYLMSGPNFLGISGVIVGMMGFCWVRHTRAPWEGYNMNPAVARFMLIFVLALFALDFGLFLLHTFTNKFSMGGISIANTAHIVGGITGYLLGYLKIFGKKNRILP